MKRTYVLGVVFALLTTLLLGGCKEEAGSSQSDGAETESTGLTLFYDPETVDSGYAEAMETYFTALQNGDFAAADAVVFPVYAEALEQYLQQQYGYGRESSFQKRYESMLGADGVGFVFTQLQFSYAAEDTISGYCTSMQDIFGEDFEARIEEEITEGHSILFSVNAKYGDAEPVCVFEDQEMIAVKSKDGKYYLFG